MTATSKHPSARRLLPPLAALMVAAATSSTAQERIPDSERSALIAIFHATHGDRWKETTGWLSRDNGKQGDPGTECDWVGVTCDDQKRHVTGLSLSESGLAGVLPPSIGDLAQLDHLDLSFNRLQGQLPPDLFRLRHLTRLDLSNNQFQGNLPSTLAGLANIESLNLSRNYLTGPIRQIGALLSLVYLDLADNLFDGPLPSSFGALHDLKRLDVSGNSLTGGIPPQIGNMSSVLEVFLAHNRLTSELPADLGKLTELQALHLSYNRLEGTFPASLGKLQNLGVIAADHNAFAGPFPASLCRAALIVLDLSWNHLGGEMPSDIAKCSRLDQLYLSHNELKGRLPSDALASMDSLQALDLSDNAFSGDLAGLAGARFSLLHLDRNQFSGPIPPELLVDSLHELTLSGNRLTGSLPAELCSLDSLRILDLSHNRLTGTLCDPAAASHTLEDLAALNLSHNQLTGPLPAGLFALEELASLDLSHNQFTGPLPEIAGLRRLQILDLSDNQLRDAVRLGKLPLLTSVNLSHNGFTSGLEELAAAKSLRRADLRDNPWARPVPPRLVRIETAVNAPALAVTAGEAESKRPPRKSLVVISSTRDQSVGSSLAGSVVDPFGAVVAGAKVTVESPAASGPTTVTTDSQGRFQFIMLPSNDYNLTIESQGFQKVQQRVSIQEGYHHTANVTLAVGSTAEMITVFATQPKTHGPWWNTWIARRGALETARETFLVPGHQYCFYLELSAIQARDAARGGTFKEITADLRKKLVHLVQDGTPFQPFFVRISIIGRAVQLSSGVTSVQAWSPSSQQWTPSSDSGSSGAFQADLSKLFPDLVTGSNSAAASGGRAGAIQFGITAGEKPGCAAIAVSIWDDTRMVPLDHLVRMVSVGQNSNCAGEIIENPTSPALYSDTARSVNPDVSLHIFEFQLQGEPHSASFMVLRNPTSTTCKGSYQWDSLATLSQQVLKSTQFTNDLDFARQHQDPSQPPQDRQPPYAPVAKDLTSTVFSEADTSNPCGAAAALAALKQQAQSGDVRLFARVSDDQGTLNVVPLGLMSMYQEQGQNVFAHDIRLIQPVALESLEDTGCVSTWTFVLPSNLDGFTQDQLMPPSSLSGDPRVLRSLDAFSSQFINAPDTAGPNGLLLLAHHLNGILTTVAADKLNFGQINRDLGPGSIAILSACKTGNLTDDTGLIRGLNQHGVDAMVATAFELDEIFGKTFAFNFAEQVAHLTQSLTVEQAFTAALAKTVADLGDGSTYTPDQARGLSLELVLAGNPNLKICSPKPPSTNPQPPL